MNSNPSIHESPTDDWQQRLAVIVDMMREMSVQTDPQAMVRAYASKIRQVIPIDRSVSISRRDLSPPKYRITRSTLWKDEVNPWRQKERLPLLEGGLLGELIYREVPRIIDDLQIAADDPAAEYFAGQRSLMALPNFDGGHALNMVVLMRSQPAAFQREELPELVWMSNLFGRATQNLVLSEELQRAYNRVDHELRVVANIQRSLLPAALPEIATMELAAHYQTSSQAGGDYYDFFPLPDGKWGILIADVSGHGTPAAVIMAITHGLAHAHLGPQTPPCRMSGYLNDHLTRRYTGTFGAFVTAFYGIYDPATRELIYASAGHNPPRVKHCGGGPAVSLDGPRNLPLGIAEGEPYIESRQVFRPGDRIAFYTDGIVEAMNPAGQMFDLKRLDQAIDTCREAPADLIAAVLAAVEQFTAGRPADDDRTLLVAKIT